MSSSLRDECVALAWSLWSELGVSGLEKRHREWFIDPEPLIVFTAWLGDEDARLRDEATDWCIQFGSWISGTRLTNMLVANEAAKDGYAELAATVARHSTLRWRGAGKARAFNRSHKSRLPSFDHPALVSLRLRALFGVDARAETLRLFLGAPTSMRAAASTLVDEVGFKKRNVADSLDALHRGGALEMTKSQNKLVYRLRAQPAWRAVLGKMPTVWPRWSAVLPLVARASDALDRVKKLPLRSARVQLHKLKTELAPLAERADFRTAFPTQDEDLDGLEAWLRHLAAALARGDASELTHDS